MTELYIKNMVCPRCISAIEQLLESQSVDFEYVQLGYVRLISELSSAQTEQLGDRIKDLGFELLDNPKNKLVERIKTVVITKIFHQSDTLDNWNWSDWLSNELSHDYNYLSALFSSLEGNTIEQYIIRQKIERAKELISYNELSLKEIAFALGYSSVAHFSSQFKKTASVTPSAFRKDMGNTGKRSFLDSVL